jgi:hypothetical protein
MSTTQDWPRIAARPKLVRCGHCNEFVYVEDRYCPMCGTDRVLLALLDSGRPELVQAVLEHHEERLREAGLDPEEVLAIVASTAGSGS